MEEQPAQEPSVVASNYSNSRKFKPLLLLIVLIILLLVGGVFIQSKFKKTTSEPTKAHSQELAVTRQAKFEEEALSKDRSYLRYRSLFGVYSGNYSIYSKKEDRLKMEETAKSAKDEFPKDYKDLDFVIPCFDDGCTLLTPDVDIKAILDSISSISSKEATTKNLAVNGLKSLKYYDSFEASLRFTVYNSVFKSLVNLYEVNDKDTKFKPILEQMRQIIAQKFPENYAVFSGRKYYEF